MKLLYVNSTRRWGGVKSWSLRTARALAAHGHEVSVAGRRGDPFLTACGEAGLPVLPCAFGASWSPVLIARFVAWMRRTGVQAVVCNTGRDLSTAGVAAWLCGVPVVHRVGSATDFRDTWVRRLVHRRVVRRMLVPADVMRRELLDRFPWIRPEEVAVSWNAAEAPVGGPSHGQSGRVVCLGRLAKGKGLEGLLRAVATVKKAGLSLQLDVVGEGELEPELRHLVRELGLDECVRMPGFIRPASHALQLAQVGVLPSLAEGFPNTLIEYWAAGLAVVASDLPGVREAMDGDAAALLVPPGDEEALAGMLCRVLENEDLRLNTAEAGLARMAKCFSTVLESKRLECFYEDLVRRLPV